MTKLKNGIFGPISGKLGPVVGATWKGIPYLRLLPKKRQNGTKRTAAQVANQYKFKFLNAFLVPFHPYLNNGFRQQAAGKTEINAAFTANYPAVLGVHPSLEIDFSKIIISKGELEPLINPVVSWISEKTLVITWETNLETPAAFDDQPMVVLYSPEIKQADGFVGGIKRAAKSTFHTLEEKFIGLDLEVYLAVISLDGKRVSDTVYLGRKAAL